jgi:hypothetical protein
MPGGTSRCPLSGEQQRDPPGSEPDPQRAKASNETRMARRGMEEERAEAIFLCERRRRRRVQSAICSERKRAIGHGWRAGAWRRNERRRSSSARDGGGGGFRERDLQRAKASNRTRMARGAWRRNERRRSSSARDGGGGFRARSAASGASNQTQSEQSNREGIGPHGVSSG